VVAVSIDELHNRAMELADEAEAMEAASREKFRQAAVFEEKAADAVLEEQVRTRGILCLSAVSLHMMAGDRDRAADLAQRYRTFVSPGFARELDEVLKGEHRWSR